MFKGLSNIVFNSAPFTSATLLSMNEMHPSMQRLYATARRRRGVDVSQSDLARALNTSSQRINNWEARGISDKGATEAEAVFGVSPLWLKEGKGSEPFGDSPAIARSDRPRAAPKDESAGEIAADYVRFQLLDGAGGMGTGAVNEDYPEVIRELEIAEWEVRRKLGFLPAPGRIHLLTGRGPSMRPRIDHGDVVMVDTSITFFDGDAIYVISLGGETQIKMLQMRGDGLYVVSANPDYPPYCVAESDGLHIGGKVVSALGFKEM